MDGQIHAGNLRPGESGDGGPSESSESLAQSGKKLDLELLLSSINNCINEDGTVTLEYYIKAYREINRFFELLGTVFHFVAKDVHSKILILEDYQKSELASHFKTVQSMIVFEREHDLLNKSCEPPSGSRTLLRLHRAMQFIIEFLRNICSATDDERVAACAQNAYNSTLAKYHPWIIRKTANIAMFALPVKRVLMKQTCQQDHGVLNILIPQVVQSASNLYTVVESIYRENNLLDLP